MRKSTGLDVAITDPRGVTSTRRLSASGEVGETSVTLEDTSVLKTGMRYTAFGGMKSYTDANNRTTTFTVDVFGRTTSAQYPDAHIVNPETIDRPGATESFTYDGEGLLTAHTDRRGFLSTMTYDNVRRETSRVVAGIPVMRHVYDDAARTVAKIDANDHSTLCAYDGLMRIVKLTNADGKEMTYGYDGINLRSQSDFKGKLTRFDYDNVDRLVRVQDRTEQHETIIAHTDVDGHTMDVTDRRGNHRVEVSDALGRMVSVTQGNQPLVSYEYDPNSNRSAIIDGRGNRTAYLYDNANRVREINRSGIQTERMAYDGVGNVISHNDGFGADQSYTYDGLDRVMTHTDGAGNTTVLEFDGEGLMVRRVEPKRSEEEDFTTSYEYNGLGSLTRVVDAKQKEWVYEYDPAQNLTLMKDAKLRETRYEYDALDRLKRVIQPLNTISEYEYDENSNRVKVTDPLRQTTLFVYDELDRVRRADYFTANEGIPTQGPRRHSFSYDPEGNLTSVEETTAFNNSPVTRSYARTYDSRNRLESETDAFSRTLRYAYDPTNNLTRLTDSASVETSYSYDPMNRLSLVTMSGGRSASYRWKADGLIEQVSYSTGMTREWSYDQADRLVSIKNSFSAEESEEYIYGYDKNSNRASEIRRKNGAEVRRFEYEHDELDRLRKITSGADTLEYEYDEVGNRLSERGKAYDGGTVNRTYSYNELNRLTTVTGDAAGTISFIHDANGNLISQSQGATTTSYQYDTRDQLRKVINGTSEVARFDYDYERRRLSKATAVDQLSYVYAGERVVNEYGNEGQLVNRYDYGADLLRGEIGGGERYYFTDALGSVTALATSTGAVAGRYEYDAWGVSYNPSASLNRVGYTGQRLDAETGLMALGNGERYCQQACKTDPLTGMKN
ncbi:MAG: hypothetical protein AB1631_03835 [Acidobacteriota bacterium]